VRPFIFKSQSKVIGLKVQKNRDLCHSLPPDNAAANRKSQERDS